jgi:hypothetical protein
MNCIHAHTSLTHTHTSENRCGHQYIGELRHVNRDTDVWLQELPQCFISSVSGHVRSVEAMEEVRDKIHVGVGG